MRPALWTGLLLSLCLIARPAAVLAQPMARTLDELRLLIKAGDSVTVTDAAGRRTSGTITALNPSALVLRVDGVPRELMDADIARVTHRRADSLANGALWGLGVGAALVSAAVAAAAADDEFDDRDTGWVLLAVGFYGAAGAGVGVGIDALRKKEVVIYQKAPPAAARWRLAPVISPRVQGARLSVRF